MAHTAPPDGSRRKLEIVLGVVLLLVGASALYLAILGLSHPKGQQTASSPTSDTASRPASTSARPSSGSAGGSSTRSSGASASSSTPPALSSSAPAASAIPTSSATSTAAAAGRLPLVVLNNTSSTDGSVAADRFRQGGWSVTAISTFSGDILSTAAYYDPDTAGAEAAADALAQQFPAIKRVKPKFDGLPSGPVVVVLTSDYS